MDKYRNPNLIANEIRMMRSQHKGSFLLVEGSTDARLFERLVDKKNCKVLFSNGKDNALKSIDILDKAGFKGVLAIVDADFWIVENFKVPNSSILTTDAHDLETMFIFSKAFDNVLAEFGSTAKLGSIKKGLKDIIVELALPIGSFRLISSPTRKNLQLKFQGINYDAFIDFRSMKVDLIKLIDEVKANSKNSKIDVKKLKIEIENLMVQLNGFTNHICSGHDLVEIFTSILVRGFGNSHSKNLDSNFLSTTLRLAYHFDCFSTTHLYTSIRKWELANAPFRVLDSVSAQNH